MNRLGIILLAAGGSRRLGTAKQLLDVNGKALVRHTVDRLLELQPASLCVVLGASADRVEAALSGLSIETVINAQWPDGIGTSIAQGAKKLLSRTFDSILIALCDQPAIPTAHYRALWGRFDAAAHDIVASEYEGSPGVPAVFAPALLPALASLSGDRGAKGLMLDPTYRVIRMSCDAARIDLDTPSDVAAFSANRASGL